MQDNRDDGEVMTERTEVTSERSSGVSMGNKFQTELHPWGLFTVHPTIVSELSE